MRRDKTYPGMASGRGWKDGSECRSVKGCELNGYNCGDIGNVCYFDGEGHLGEDLGLEK